MTDKSKLCLNEATVVIICNSSYRHHEAEERRHVTITITQQECSLLQLIRRIEMQRCGRDKLLATEVAEMGDFGSVMQA